MKRLIVSSILFGLLISFASGQTQLVEGKEKLLDLVKDIENFINDLPDSIKLLQQEDYVKSSVRFAEALEDIEENRKSLVGFIEDINKGVKISISLGFSEDELPLVFSEIRLVLYGLVWDFQHLSTLNDLAYLGKSKNQLIGQRLIRLHKNALDLLIRAKDEHLEIARRVVSAGRTAMQDRKTYKEALVKCESDRSNIENELANLKKKLAKPTNPKVNTNRR